MDSIKFDIDLWANPPDLTRRHAVVYIWRALVQLATEPEVWIGTLPDFAKWNAAGELVDDLDLGISVLDQWRGEAWLPDEVLEISQALLDEIQVQGSSFGECFWLLSTYQTDVIWLEIRQRANEVALQIRLWVEAVGLTLDRENPLGIEFGW